MRFVAQVVVPHRRWTFDEVLGGWVTAWVTTETAIERSAYLARAASTTSRR
jgi:hypothetical protein